MLSYLGLHVSYQQNQNRWIVEGLFWTALGKDYAEVTENALNFLETF